MTSLCNTILSFDLRDLDIGFTHCRFRSRSERDKGFNSYAQLVKVNRRGTFYEA